MSNAHHVISMPVWGERYLDMFLNVSLPSQLSPGNLPAFAHPRSCTYRLYTFRDDGVLLDAAPAVRHLRRHATVEIIVLPESFRVHVISDKFGGMEFAHRHSLLWVMESPDRVLIPMLSDLVFSDGALYAVDKVIGEGAQAAVMTTPRGVLEAVGPLLTGLLQNGVLTVSPRTLYGMIFANQLPSFGATIWGSVPSNPWPNHLQWEVEDEGSFHHTYHPYPIMLRAHAGSPDVEGTMDGNWVYRLVDDPSRLHIFDNSDEMCVIELSPRDYLADDLIDEPATVISAASYFFKYRPSPLQMEVFRRPLRYYTRDPGSAWQSRMAESRRVVESVISVVDILMAKEREMKASGDPVSLYAFRKPSPRPASLRLRINAC
ncbi:MAG: hypothetical protein H7840_02720 [Alphaproteobacteria bacterium]